MSHLHIFPCPTKYSHYQSRDTCKIPTLSTFPSKPYEPWDMKGNLGKYPHWDTSESSMCISEVWKRKISVPAQKNQVEASAAWTRVAAITCERVVIRCSLQLTTLFFCNRAWLPCCYQILGLQGTDGVPNWNGFWNAAKMDYPECVYNETLLGF